MIELNKTFRFSMFDCNIFKWIPDLNKSFNGSRQVRGPAKQLLIKILCRWRPNFTSHDFR
jgi:hypothetical protein